MKKSVKIVIIVLSLIIVGLITFIIVDKAILSKNNETSKSNNSTVNQVDNGKGASVNAVEENEVDTNNSVNVEKNNNVKNEVNNDDNSGKTTNSNNQDSKNVDENEKIKKSLLNKGWYEALKDDLSVNYGSYTKEQINLSESNSKIYKIDSSRAGVPIYLVVLSVNANDNSTTLDYICTVRDGGDKIDYDIITSTKNGWDSIKVDNRGLLVMTEINKKGYIINTYYRIYEKGYTVIEKVALLTDIDGTKFQKTVYDNNDNVKEEKEISKSEYNELKESYENDGLKEMSIELTKENADKYIKD